MEKDRLRWFWMPAWACLHTVGNQCSLQWQSLRACVPTTGLDTDGVTPVLCHAPAVRSPKSCTRCLQPQEKNRLISLLVTLLAASTFGYSTALIPMTWREWCWWTPHTKTRKASFRKVLLENMKEIETSLRWQKRLAPAYAYLGVGRLLDDTAGLTFLSK